MRVKVVWANKVKEVEQVGDMLFDKENNCYSLSQVILLDGWHPASELPTIPKGEDEVEVYCLVHGKGLTVLVPMKLHYTVSHGFGVSSKNIEIKWWCYPPKEE